MPRWIPTLLCLCTFSVTLQASDLDRAPIHYTKAAGDNPITRLQKQIASGDIVLRFDDEHGYLPSVLDALDVPKTSQVLVFSKTSLQREKISPKTPRAIYFNDDVTIGFCFRGDVLEVTAADPTIGTAFYTLDQEPAHQPRFLRHSDNCLVCHGSSGNRGMPGHMIRSVFTDTHGFPILSAGSTRVDHSTPFEHRWGGWYVTGTHGDMHHRGNQTLTNRKFAGDTLPNPEGVNVRELQDRFTTGNYLTPHSDVVALLVLEHQGEMHNQIARATLETRMALHYQDELNKAMKEPATNEYDSVKSRIRSVGNEVVKYLLFHEEAKLTARVEGTSGFQKEFAERGPRDPQGRSLRDFDLQTRVFKYRCSYLIYSEAFDRMPSPVRDYVLDRLHKVLIGEDDSPEFAHLEAAERQAIREILLATKPNLPEYWKQ